VRHAFPGRPRDPFSAALDALRTRLGDGKLILGEPLTITDLAHELGLSATPVREALSRLAGEGLIEDRRGRGYFARRLDVADVVELYSLRRLYLLAAIDATPSDGKVDLSGIDDGNTAGPGARMAHVFSHLAAGAGNRALMEAYQLICDRMVPAVRVEAGLFPLADEVARLETLVGEGSRAWIQAVTEVHEVRQARAGEIVRAMRARANISTL